MLEVSFDLFINTLKPDTHLTIWDSDKSKTKYLFNGKAYKLYDYEKAKQYKVVCLMYSFNGSITVLVEKEV